MALKRYCTRSRTVDAIKWTGKNIKEVEEFCDKGWFYRGGDELLLDTPDGRYEVTIGDYIILDEFGSYYRIPEFDFDANYKEAPCIDIPYGSYYSINPKFKIGDVAIGISQKKIPSRTLCKSCNGIGETELDGCKYICQRCFGSGREPIPELRWYVDPEPLIVAIIKASISKYQSTFKYKCKTLGGTPYNRSDATLFRTMEEAQMECDKRNKPSDDSSDQTKKEEE